MPKISVSDFIRMAGDKLGVPETFRNAIFGIESAGGRPDIQDSVKGAMGPGQLMPDTAKGLGVNPRVPWENIMGSLRLQKKLIDKYRGITNGDETKAWLLAAAAYNAGEGAVEKHGGIPPYKETRNYVKMMAQAIKQAGGTSTPQQQQRQGTGLPEIPSKPSPSPLTNKRPPKTPEVLTDQYQSANKAARPTSSPLTNQRPAKTPEVLIDQYQSATKPARSAPLQSSTSTPSTGLTPPPSNKGVFQDLSEVLPGINPIYGVFSEDTRRSFLEGATKAIGRTIADVGWLASVQPSILAAQYLLGGTKKQNLYSGVVQPFGEGLEKNAVISSERHAAPTTLGRFRQAAAEGTGAALIELPKLIGTSFVYGPATLPTLGAISGARTEGAKGLVKGAIGGVVYHYGGQITGKYLGKIGNSLIWVGAPAVEQHLVNGVPLEQALGENLSMGLFAGVTGSNKVRVETRGGVRDAKVGDLKGIESGRLKVLEPEQLVMSSDADVARKNLAQHFQEAIANAPAEDVPAFKAILDGFKARLSGGEGGFAQVKKFIPKGESDPNWTFVDILPAGQHWDSKLKKVVWRDERYVWEDKDGLPYDVDKKGYNPDDIKREKEQKSGGQLKRLPKWALSDLTSIGAQYYEMGKQSMDDWASLMLKEIGETPESVKPEVMKQMGEVFARSKQMYDEYRAPIFFSGLKQTVKELKALNLIGNNVQPDRLINLLKQRGQAEELEASGLIEKLLSYKADAKGQPLKLEDIIQYLDTEGMTMEVVRGRLPEWNNSKFSYNLAAEQGAPGVLPGVGTRAALVSSGGRDYFEGLVVSNKALDFSTDEWHFGSRPDQISWYRAQMFGGEKAVVGEGLSTPSNMALLEEVQSKRSSRARDFGVTKDPDNAHSRLISLEREIDVLDRQASDIEEQLGLSRWQPTDEYSRYEPRDDYSEGGPVEWADAAYERQISGEQIKQLDKLRASINSLENEINNLSHVTDTSEVPWAPHLDTWYEPALKGFLREAAERLEPDQDGNIRVTWTSASEQLSRYPKIRKEIEKVSFDKFKNPETGEMEYAVETYFHQGPQLRSNLEGELTEKRLYAKYGKDIAQPIVHSEANRGELNVGKVAVGGEWAVKVYGDTKENIQLLYPNRPELEQYAWGTSGNRAIVPAYFEKYAGADGGRIELIPEKKINPAYVEGDTVVYPTPAEIDTKVPHLIIPEAMRQRLLKRGQLFFGRSLPALPKGQGEGLRNIIVNSDEVRAARERLGKRFKTVSNPVTGERIPSPERSSGGFLQLRPDKTTLDPRVETDFEDRKRDISGPGVFFRSPSRWLLGHDDPRIDAIEGRWFEAEVREHDHITNWGRRFSAIIDHLKTATFSKSIEITQSGYTIRGERNKERRIFGKRADKEALDKTYSEFINLIEKDFRIESGLRDTENNQIMIDNPERRSSNPLIQRALEEHDALTKDFKNYLIDSYESRGIEIRDKENWGISEKGYFRHLFPGEDNVFMNGEFISPPEGRPQGWQYVDAVKFANDLIAQNQDAKIEIRRRPIQFVDPSLRVSTKSYERLVRSLVGSINEDGEQIISAREIRQDLVGEVGKKENISKFFGAALKREGYEGFLRDYEQVMRAHYFQLARSQELSKLRKDITPTLEELRREGKRGVVEGIERHLDDLWGKPLDYEKRVGGLIRRFPALRERVANPDLGMEIAARRIASMWNLLSLRYNPKAVMVNRLQPLRTLWPYLTTPDMLEVVKRFRDPSWKQAMTELGVMSGAVKLESGGSRVEGFGAKEFIKDPFTYVSGSNRALGYTAGIIFAERSGITGFEAHKLGMRWAAKVEFDNSKWDAPRVLRHSLGQVFGQYKGFLIKDIENTIDVFSRQAGDRPGPRPLGFEISRSKASRVGKWFIGTAVPGGLRASLSPIPWLGTAVGYSMYLGATAGIKALTGASDKDAKFAASLLFLGAPSATGVDISASLTPIDDPPGQTAWEKLDRFALGPTASKGYDIARAARQVVKPGPREVRPLGERLFNFGTKWSPYVRMVQRGLQLAENTRTGKTQYLTIEQHRVPLTRAQMALGALGVPPSNQTLYYEEKEATGKSPLAAHEGKGLFGEPSRGFLTTPFRPLPKR